MEYRGLVDNIPETVKELSEVVFKARGFDNCTVTVEDICEKGDNYASNVKRLIAQNEERKFQIVAKIASDDEATRMMMFSDVCFNNEIVFYTELMPKFVELQTEAGIPADDQFSVADCYGAKGKELIILEDLNVKEYRTLDKYVPLKHEEIELVMKKLAKFHALSFVLKQKDESCFDGIANKMIDLLECYGDVEEFFMLTIEHITACFNEYNYQSFIKEIMTELPVTVRELKETKDKSVNSVFMMGDVWTNNILFKFKDNQPVDAKLIDFQQTRPGNPTIDIQTFILNCTDYETRRKSYKRWLDCYYQTFEEFLSKFNIDSNDVYPRKEFDGHLKTFARINLGMSIFGTSITARDKDNLIDINETMAGGDIEISAFSKKSLQLITSKVDGMMKSYNEFGYI